MANEEQVRLLKAGVEGWNRWRGENPGEEIDLTEADLRGAILLEADLRGANLIETYLRGANLREADLRGAILLEADLTEANLIEADLRGADLRGADLNGADLEGANLSEANLSEADLSNTTLYETYFANVNLRDTIGLETCKHLGPSTIGLRTIRMSWPLPRVFLRGCGLDEHFIDYIPSLIGQPIQYYSCFISYSSKDSDFSKRLHADLQDVGVRCWFAPEDLKIGDKIRYAIDEAIRLRDKLLVVLSENSIESDWVETEVETALEEERERKTTVLFPVRLDEAVMETKKPWARLLRRERHIGDFTGWKDHDRFQGGFQRLLRDLKMEQA